MEVACKTTATAVLCAHVLQQLIPLTLQLHRPSQPLPSTQAHARLVQVMEPCC